MTCAHLDAVRYTEYTGEHRSVLLMKESKKKRSLAPDTPTPKRTRLETLSTYVDIFKRTRLETLPTYVDLSLAEIFRQERGFSCAMKCFSFAELCSTFQRSGQQKCRVEKNCV